MDIKNIDKQQLKLWAIVIGVILVVLFVVWYFGYKRGSKKTTISPLTGDDPNSTDPNNNPAGMSDSDIKMLASNLHDDMEGSNFFGHNDDLFSKVTELSDTDVQRLYNEFNTQYQSDSGQTFTQWIAGEAGAWSGGVFDNLRTSILARLAKLNLV